jgi:choline dehydrogenase-like flavoprotein
MSAPGRIVTGDELTQDTQVEADVCVIGSGSGGAWLAHELVARGLEVVLLEEGGYHTRRAFELTERFAFPNLYQELGARSTDDLAISILQGRSVGGGTTVNWCSSFRTPKRVLDFWRAEHGIDTLSEQVLTPHWEAIERRLHIAEWPLERINAHNKVLWDGLGKLGMQRGLIRRNVNGCVNLGYCGMGCPIDAKQSMLVTVLPDAVEKGLALYANVSARRIEWDGRKAKKVHCDVFDPKTDRPGKLKLAVSAKVIVASCGAINSPALLLRSGLPADGRVGQRTWLHPVVPSLAEFEHEVRPFEGAPQSVYSHHHLDRGAGKIGYFLEVAPVHPMLAATIAMFTGTELGEWLGRLPRLGAAIALTVDGFLPEEVGGTVRLRDGAYNRLSVKYPLGEKNWEAFRSANKDLARVQFAAGAKRVMSLHNPGVVMTSEAEIDKLDAAPWEPLRVRIASAHQMGGCAMGKEAGKSVVDPTLRFHGLDNLFVVDGSVLPTALGVNPQETIFGLSRWAASGVAAAV